MRLGVLFPGQGSQSVGMGSDVFDRRPDLLGRGANEILGFDLRSICLDGPEEELMRTEHAQPAIFALSYALYDELNATGEVKPGGMAGHSLGEYTALAASGALGYETALRLVGWRGRAMAEAAALEPSGMAALIGSDLDSATSVCERRVAEGGRLEVANVNAPGQIVVAGGAADIEWLVGNHADLGIRRVVPLKVAGAFHSGFMEPARLQVTEALAGVAPSEPDPPVWANTTASPHVVSEIADTLARQVVEPVLFAETLENMYGSGIDVFVHCGPGDVTAGLVRKTLPHAKALVVSSVDDIRETLDVLGTIG